jgi:predicted ATP-binding protein involved in virulence
MLFGNTTTLYDPESILRDLDYAAQMKKESAAERRDQFLGLIAPIAPRIGHVDNIVFLGPSIVADPQELTGVKFKNSFGLVPFSEMSLGQQTTIAWAVDLAWRLVRLYPTSKNPLAEPAIVLVDEIDLHLHPRWQQDLRTYLVQHFPAVQFIATAHSPLMAQASLDANLVVLQEQDGQIQISNDVDRLHDWRLDQVVTALFGLPSARPPNIQAMFDERDQLLDTPKRNPDQEARLVELKSKIAGLSSPAAGIDETAMDIIRRAAARLGGATV